MATPETKTWYVYRHELSSSVLKAPETSLEITAVSDIWQARFELSDLDKPFKVELRADAASGAWQNSMKGSFDFRLDRIAPDVLIGQVFDRTNPSARRDSFVAVRSKRTNSLPDQTVYHFGSAQYIPFERDQPSESKSDDVAVDLSQNTITLDGKIYTITKNTTPPEGGLRLEGLHRNPEGLPEAFLRLWILPMDGTTDLLATGYQVLYGPHLHRPSQRSGPSEPHCNLCLQLQK